MSSKSADLRDAIVESLNDPANDFVMKFKAEGAITPLSGVELQELSTLRVLVFNGSMKVERMTRGSFRYTFKPVIAFHRRLDEGNTGNNLELANKLIELSEQIAVKFQSVDFAELHLSFVGLNDELENNLYSEEALQAMNLFVHAMTLEYTTG